MTAEIIPFRPRPSAPEAYPMLPMVTAYFIGLAIFGIVAIMVLDSLAGTGKR